MTRFLIAPALAITLVLGGCAGTKVGDLISAATTTIVNPIDSVDIYRVKNTQAVTLELAVQWRRTCWSDSYANLMKNPATKLLCQSRRPTLRAMQGAYAKADLAITQAELFIRNNPTLNAATVLQAAWNAVSAYRNAIPR